MFPEEALLDEYDGDGGIKRPRLVDRHSTNPGCCSGYECSFVRKRWIIDWSVVFRCERGCMEIYYRDADAWTKTFGSRQLA